MKRRDYWKVNWKLWRRRFRDRRPVTDERLTAQAKLERRPGHCRGRNLRPETTIVVKVASFTFRFGSTSCLDDMIRNFEATPRGGDRRMVLLHGHRTGEGEQRPFSKLPMWLKTKKYRPIVLKALTEARSCLA